MQRNEVGRREAAWRTALAVVILAATANVASSQDAGPQPPERPGRRRPAATADGGNYAAFQLLRRAEELLESGGSDEADRGVKMLETILEQYPADPIRFKAYLALGKHALARNEQKEAVGFLRNLESLEQPGKQMDEATRELFLEGLYLQGIAFFQTKQYAQAFPRLRRITNDFPKTVWANQSYYYIGMCHFAQGKWKPAIEALSLVGTFVDDKVESAELAEAGRRIYVKIEDADLPVMAKLGQEAQVTVAAASGDTELVPLVPLPGDGAAAIASVGTVLGTPKPGDGVLQIRGGDTVKASYIDGNTLDGIKDVGRSREIRLVGTASISFTKGTFDSLASAAFLGEPVFVVLTDPDLDVSPRADGATVQLMARFKEEEGTEDETAATKGVDIEKMLRSEQESWRTRDMITLQLTELPQADGGDDAAKPAEGVTVHSGRFAGQAVVAAAVEDQPVNQSDDVLTAALGDEIVVTYLDEKHIGGAPRTISATIVVAAGIEGKLQNTFSEVGDPVVAAKKNLVEGTAYLELGRIFRSMGLLKIAKDKVGEGLARIDPIIRQTAGGIPKQLTEEAFRTKWDLHMVADDLGAAIATCEMFNRLYPESPFVDTALLQIAKISEEMNKPAEAIGIYQRILGLPSSLAKAEAQYRIARATEKLPSPAAAEQAIVQYKICADRYPDSPYAGESLGKLVDYHFSKNDNAAADELLTQIFQDYQDATFLDAMLLKWVMVAFRSGDLAKARDKCSQLLFEYPESPYAAKARDILPKIEAKLTPASSSTGGDEK